MNVTNSGHIFTSILSQRKETPLHKEAVPDIAWNRPLVSSGPVSLFHVLYQVMLHVELDLDHSLINTHSAQSAPMIGDRSHQPS